LGTGLLAGGGRIFFGGFAGIPSSVATVLLGAFAGVVRYYFPQWIKNTWGVFGVALIGTLFQRLVLVLMVTPHDEAVLLAWKIGVPVGVVNIAGCVLFFWLMSDLDRERLENAAEEARLLALQAQVERDRQGQLAQQSELRALRAQVDPHFLNNTLNDLTALIRLDANKARRYVAGLADFFNYTREFAGHNSISLQQELEQLQRYLTLQRLSLGDKLQESVEVPPNLLSLQVLPGCLLTLAENALKHAFKGMSAPYKLHIVAREVAENLMLSVQDNGNGIVPERLALLGKNPVHSSNKSGGVALYNLAQSLMLEFGETAKLDIQCNHANGTVVSLTQPKRSTI
ncbi:MAG: histidine kinase, partial [Methylococcales bacterium]